jgi:predicted phosphodiesterase
LLEQTKPDIFICGHSHILKVIFDKNLNLLHINPGAAGKQGLHSVRTMVRFVIGGSEIKNMDVIQLGKRGED